MRSALLVLITVLLLAVGFAIYAVMQPATSPGEKSGKYTFNPTTAPASVDDGSKAPTFRAGEAPWVQEFSETTGELRSQFRAAKYEPTPNHGPVNVTLPDAEFFLGSDKAAKPGTPLRVLRVQGKTGQVITTESAKRHRSVVAMGGAAVDADAGDAAGRDDHAVRFGGGPGRGGAAGADGADEQRGVR